jgi:hypothetical protein
MSALLCVLPALRESREQDGIQNTGKHPGAGRGQILQRRNGIGILACSGFGASVDQTPAQGADKSPSVLKSIPCWGRRAYLAGRNGDHQWLSGNAEPATVDILQGYEQRQRSGSQTHRCAFFHSPACRSAPVRETRRDSAGSERLIPGCLDNGKKHGMLIQQSPYYLPASSQVMFDIPRMGSGIGECVPLGRIEIIFYSPLDEPVNTIAWACDRCRNARCCTPRLPRFFQGVRFLPVKSRRRRCLRLLTLRSGVPSSSVTIHTHKEAS